MPHPRLAERSFVLDPLCEIARHVVHPVLGVSIGELARRARECERRRRHGRERARSGAVVAIVAVSIAPSGAGVSMSHYVAAALRVLEQQDRVRWKLDSMFTTLEGDVDEIFGLIRQMQEAVFAAGATRVGTVVKMDDRRDKAVRMEDKVRAVEAKLARDES